MLKTYPSYCRLAPYFGINNSMYITRLSSSTRYIQRGITLVEVMVVVAIIVILLAFGLPSFKSWLQSSQIRNAAESIQNGLQLARAEAVRRNARVEFVFTTNGSDWTTRCVVPIADINGDGVADCPGIGTTPANIQSGPATEGALNAVVGLASTAVTFNGMGRATPATNIDITNPTGGVCATTGSMRCLRVVVATGGQIRMCDPIFASTDPRGC